MSVAWPASPLIEAAWSRAVLPAATFAGDAGSAPGTSPSGSDQEADWKVNGTPGIAAAICERRAAPPEEAWPASFTSAVTDRSVPGAVLRSCCTASGSAWPMKTATAAATAAATSVVRAAAASTPQYAVMRRAAIGPRGLNTSKACRTNAGTSNVKQCKADWA